MKSEKYYLTIENKLSEYKKLVDELIKRHGEDKKKLEAKLEEMKKQSYPEYVKKYEKENNPDNKYRALFDGLQKDFVPVIKFYTGLIEKETKAFFHGAVDPDFANKIQAIKATGLQLTDFELEILKDECKSYIEMRLVEELANTRTKKVERYVRDPKNPEHVTTKYENVPDPCIKLNFPKIETIMKEVAQYNSAAMFMVENYCGAKGEIASLLPNKMDPIMAVSADSFFTNNYTTEIEKTLKKFEWAFSKEKQGLTAEETALIDTMIDPKKSPDLQRNKIREISKGEPEIAEVLARDNRYNQYL